MLEYLRNAADKPVAKILIGILAFSFVGWGVAEWIFGSVAGDDTLVKVGNKEISIQDFNLEKSRQLATMDRDEQRLVYTDALAGQQFNDNILTLLAAQKMTENRADDLGFVVTDKRIADEIASFPEFQLNGQFSTFLFDTVLSSSGYTEAGFAEVLRSQVLRSMVMLPVSVPMNVPQFMVDAVYNARYRQIGIDYSVVDFDDFKVSEPKEEQLKEFYAKNPQRVPEQRSVSYVIVEADMAKPDSYDKAYEVAVKVEDDIIAGETMKKSAENHKAKFVNLGKFGKANIPTDEVLDERMVQRVFDMEEGLESEMIETKNGFVIVKVDKIYPEHNAEFADVKKSLVDSWKKDEQKKQAYVKANELLVDLNDGKELKGKKSAVVSRTDGAPIEVLNAAFNAKAGSNSIVPGADAFYVLHVDKDVAPKNDKEKKDAVAAELKIMNSQMLIEDYNSFLKREYPTEVNEKLFNRFFAK